MKEIQLYEDPVESPDLTRRASASLSKAELDRLLDPSDRRCPKCDAPIGWRTGKFKPFWGCSTSPR